MMLLLVEVTGDLGTGPTHIRKHTMVGKAYVTGVTRLKADISGIIFCGRWHYGQHVFAPPRKRRGWVAAHEGGRRRAVARLLVPMVLASVGVGVVSRSLSSLLVSP